jgi:hypothetical protein
MVRYREWWEPYLRVASRYLSRAADKGKVKRAVLRLNG